jgi:hypothetical protein
VLLRLAYLRVTNAFALLRLLTVSDRDKEVEILVVRHEALLVRMEVKDRPSPCRRSGGVKLEAVRAGGSPVRAGAASTKSRRSGTAGWAGRGERDGKVYARNRCRYAS